jgi:hypothetical protein
MQLYFSDRINQSSLKKLRLGMQDGQYMVIRKQNYPDNPVDPVKNNVVSYEGTKYFSKKIKRPP